MESNESEHAQNKMDSIRVIVELEEILKLAKEIEKLTLNSPKT
jgi:hypothetical protein